MKVFQELKLAACYLLLITLITFLYIANEIIQIYIKHNHLFDKGLYILYFLFHSFLNIY